MAKDEYTIPNNYSEPEIRAQLDAIQYAPTTPEVQRAPYQRIKDNENIIFSYREAALATEKQPKKWLGGLVSKTQTTTVRDLIEKESQIGGQLFGGGKFWLDNKSQSTVFHNDVADWYHLQNNPANPKKPTVLRFQTTPYTIHKLYDGREYAPTVQDLEIFVQAVEAYTQAVLALYPLDQTINDLKNDRNDDQKPSYGLAA